MILMFCFRFSAGDPSIHFQSSTSLGWPRPSFQLFLGRVPDPGNQKNSKMLCPQEINRGVGYTSPALRERNDLPIWHHMTPYRHVFLGHSRTAREVSVIPFRATKLRTASHAWQVRNCGTWYCTLLHKHVQWPSSWRIPCTCRFIVQRFSWLIVIGGKPPNPQ